MMRILKRWTEFEDEAVPVVAGQAQRREMKRSFYYGAVAILQEFISLDGVPEEEYQKVMIEMFAELEQFKDDILTGKE